MDQTTDQRPRALTRRRKRRGGALRNAAEAALVRALAAAVQHRNWPEAQALGARVGRFAAAVLGRRFALARANLQRAFPERSAAECAALARAAFAHLGTSIAETLWLLRADHAEIDRRVAVEGAAHFETACKAGRGVLLLGAHCGNWELMALRVSMFGHPLEIVGRGLDNPELNALVEQSRGRFGAKLIDAKDASALRAILGALRRGAAVGVLIDQTVVGDRGVFIDFFGRLAYTHKVLALVAAKTGAPVIPTGIVRLPDGSHRLRFEPPLEAASDGDRDRDLLENIQRMGRVIEGWIRTAPEQWLWLHDRWKKRPKPGGAAVFLDRDGTVAEEIGYVRRLEDLKLIPGAAAAVAALNARGLAAVLVTNQSGIARGYYPEAFVQRVNARLGELLAESGARLDAVYYCPHHPTEGAGPLTRACFCRKPDNGMLLQAVRDRGLDPARSFVVGDKDVDVALARSLGARAVLVQTGYGRETLARWRGAPPDFVAQDLSEAVSWVLARNAE
jgi:histidinol-phosphate phosphatase family protein